MVEFEILKNSLNYAMPCHAFVQTLSLYKIMHLIISLCIEKVS